MESRRAERRCGFEPRAFHRGFMADYHIRKIRRGKFGEASKIREELDEFIDACEQGCKLMALQELSDIRFDSSPEDL